MTEELTIEHNTGIDEATMQDLNIFQFFYPGNFEEYEDHKEMCPKSNEPAKLYWNPQVW